MSDHLSIPLESCRRLFRLGFPLLRLWGTDLIDGEVVCRCRAGRKCPPARAGKHLVSRLKPSVIRSEEELVAWVSDGGNVGLSIFYYKPGAPPCPIRLFAFDDDDGKGVAWLAERGITSPWMVKGRRGAHVYCLFPDDVPDLATRINPFKGDPIKIDIKGSGLMVLPMDNGKRLMIDGQEVTMETLHLLDHFNSLDALQAWLPRVDPRMVIPGMKERYPTDQKSQPVNDVVEPPEEGERGEKRSGSKHKKKVKQPSPFPLSAMQPPEATYHRNYWGIPYGERTRLAKLHAQKVLPSVEGKNPRGKLVKVINDSIHQYGMSDQTTWEIIRDVFNPRCRHANGSYYPWRRSEVVTAIGWAHEEGSYTTMTHMTKPEKLADREKVLQRLRQDGLRANARRKMRDRKWRSEQESRISMALQELGHITVNPHSELMTPRQHLRDGSMLFGDLYAEVERWMAKQDMPASSRKAVGGWLGSIGLETYKGRIRENTRRMRNAA
jgi:hypothetical protein